MILKRLSLSLSADLCKPTEASKSQKNDSKFSTKTKTKTFKNLNMPPPLMLSTFLSIISSKLFTRSDNEFFNLIFTN